jgi:hypothetical protein
VELLDVEVGPTTSEQWGSERATVGEVAAVLGGSHMT